METIISNNDITNGMTKRVNDQNHGDSSSSITRMESIDLSEVDGALQEMRSEYESICKLNLSLPPEMRLPREHLEAVDSGLERMYDDIYRKGLDQVQLEYGGQCKGKEIERMLLEDTFVNILEFGNYHVHGLKSGLCVRSIPALKLPDAFLELREEMLDDANDDQDEIESNANDDNDVSTGIALARPITTEAERNYQEEKSSDSRKVTEYTSYLNTF